MQNYHVILHFEGFRLLLPQHNIISVEVIEDLLFLKDNETDAQQAGIIGWVYLERQQNPVYCLSTQLTLAQALSPQHRVIVILQIAQGLFGLSCERIEPLPAHLRLHPQPLPNCMYVPDSPIENAVIYQEQISYPTTAEKLADYLFP